ncbi:hypothetical protein V6N13_148569 [Hibiscus sabdariffa]
MGINTGRTRQGSRILDARDAIEGNFGACGRVTPLLRSNGFGFAVLGNWAEWVKRHFYLSMLKSVPLVLLKKYKIFCSDAVDGAPVVLGIAETLSTGATEGAEISSSKISNAFALDVGGAFPFEESSSENWSPTSFAISSFPLGTSLPTS